MNALNFTDAENDEVNNYVYISGGKTSKTSQSSWVWKMDQKLLKQACFNTVKATRYVHQSVVK